MNLDRQRMERQYVEEPLLTPSVGRLMLYPIRYPDIYQMYKDQQAALWVAEEIKGFLEDRAQWESRLNADQRYFIEHVLAFFASADGVVNENIGINFSEEVQVAEARLAYTAIMYIEGVHQETYAIQLDTLVTDVEKKRRLFNAVEEVPCVKKKAEWAMQWMDKTTKSFATRLVAFSVVEGIFFSGSFAAIFWLRNMGLLPGLSMGNELISRDEGLHVTYAISLYSHLINKLTRDEVLAIFKSAVDIEIEFMTEALPVRLVGMNANLMIQYIKYVADWQLVRMGLEKYYNVSNPFDFMEKLSLEGKTNFFERGVTEYKKHGVNSKEDGFVIHQDSFDGNADF